MNLEYALYRPYTFDEASETIDELTHETDYAHSQSRYNNYDWLVESSRQRQDGEVEGTVPA